MSQSPNNVQKNITTSKYLKLGDDPIKLIPCKTCSNLKEQGKRCAECKRFKPDFTFKLQKTSEKEPRVVEIYHPSLLKSTTLLINKDNIDNLKSYRNIRGQWLNYRMGRNNPYDIFVIVKGGEHKMGFRMPITELEELIKLWKWKFSDRYGTTPRIPRRKTLNKLVKSKRLRKWLGFN